MNKPHLTDRATVIDAMSRQITGEGVVDRVLRLADEGKSWRLIALDLYDLTGVRVTHETVRGWAIEWAHHREPAA